MNKLVLKLLNGYDDTPMINVFEDRAGEFFFTKDNAATKFKIGHCFVFPDISINVKKLNINGLYFTNFIILNYDIIDLGEGTKANVNLIEFLSNHMDNL